MLAQAIWSAGTPEAPVASANPKVRTTGSVDMATGIEAEAIVENAMLRGRKSITRRG
jgi:hypothetical protein